MPNITLSLPEDLYRIVKEHREIRWSEVARRAIEDYARKLALLDALTSDSELTEEEIMELDEKIKKGILKHYEGKKST
jgi:hypothetical protein